MIDLSLKNINNNIYIDDDLEEALQELDILFYTENTELIGDIDFGINLEQYLWILSPAVESIKSYINDKLMNLQYLQKFQYNLDVEYISGDIKSEYRIKIDIYLENKQKIKKEYIFK